MQDKKEGEFFLQASFWIVPHLSLSGAPFLPLLSFLTSGPDFGAWPDCWVSVEFLHAPIPQKISGSTTTITMQMSRQEPE